MTIEKTHKKDSKAIEITTEDLEEYEKEHNIKLPRGLKEWKEGVKRNTLDERILEKLEELGYDVRFADSGPYVDCENKIGKYKTTQVRARTLKGKVLNGLCSGLNKDYPVYVRNAEIENDGKYYRIYLRRFNDKL